MNDNAFQAALRLLDANDLQYVFYRQRLEIETVGSVVVGGNRLRIAIDHNRFKVRLGQRQGGMNTAVVELDSLSDPVRAAAKDDDFVARRRSRLAFDVGRSRLISGI